jgi:putative spermidine/putrescine transport system permease protein
VSDMDTSTTFTSGPPSGGVTSPATASAPRQPRGRRWRFWRPSSAALLSLPATLSVLVLFIYPFIYGLILSLHGGYYGEKDWTLANYVKLFTDPQVGVWRTILTTLAIGLPTTLLSVGISIPLAYYMRRGIRFERLITTLLVLPITLGSVMVAQSMLKYFGPTGWFSRVLQLLHILNGPLFILRTKTAVDIALFIQGFPFVFSLILGYMSAINPDLERASRMLGASSWQTFRRVIWPLALPGVAVAFCLNFVANFGVFPSAVVVGDPTSDTHVIAIAAYQTAFSDYNLPLGTAIALVMGAIQLVVIALVLWLQGRVARGAAISGGKGA